MWEILLNSVLNGWLKLLIIVLARKWAVVLTNYKWAVVNSIRIQRWVVHSYKSQMGPKNVMQLRLRPAQDEKPIFYHDFLS